MNRKMFSLVLLLFDNICSISMLIYSTFTICQYIQRRQDITQNLAELYWSPMQPKLSKPKLNHQLIQLSLRLDYILTQRSTPPNTTNSLLLLLTAPASQAGRLYNCTVTASQAGRLYNCSVTHRPVIWGNDQVDINQTIRQFFNEKFKIILSGKL